MSGAKPTPGVPALFAESAAIMARLRNPQGCPWDREQTPDSIRKYTLEETYEVLDAIERRDWLNLCEELGDLLLQVLFYAQMAQEAGHFTLADVLTGLNQKLIRRHPHVFGVEASAAAGNTATRLAAVAQEGSSGTPAVLANWFVIKALEKKNKVALQGSSSLLHPVSRAQNALAEASQLGAAASNIGFDWPDPHSLLAKVHEEAAELEAELAPNTANANIAEEYGDLLFTVANLGRHLKLDPEITLRDANAKFRRRFEAMEAAQPADRHLEQLSPAELEQAWAAAKATEKPGKATQSVQAARNAP